MLEVAVNVSSALKNAARVVLSSGWSFATCTSNDASSKSDSMFRLASRIAASTGELTGPRFNAAL